MPYFANLFSPLFVFIAVIFFTSKLAGNSEIIAMLASGVSFKRLMRPYMISCVLISITTYYLGAYVIPHGTVVRQNFETMYKNRKKNNSAENVQLQVGKGVIAYIQHYDNKFKRGYGFFLDKFEDKNIEVIWGLANDDTLTDEVKITVLATGFGMESLPLMDDESEKETDEVIERIYGDRVNKKQLYLYEMTDADLDNDALIDALESSPSYQRNSAGLSEIKALRA